MVEYGREQQKKNFSVAFFFQAISGDDLLPPLQKFYRSSSALEVSFGLVLL